MQKVSNSGKISFSFKKHAAKGIMVWGADLDQPVKKAVKKGRTKEGIAWGWSKCFIPFWKPFLRSIWNENVIVKWEAENAIVKTEAETF